MTTSGAAQITDEVNNNVQVPLPLTQLQSPVAQPSPDQGTEALKDIVFGSTAGIIGKIIEYPFDTIKVRLQSQPLHLPPLYAGPLDCIRQSLRSDGLLSLYRGISAPLLGAAIETSSLFFSYRIAQNILLATTLLPSQEKGAPLPLSALVACGAASGAFTSFLLTPIELVKCQMQVSPSTSSLATTNSSRLNSPNRGPISIITSVFRHHGLFGFWHGQLGTLIRETGGGAAWFGSYEGVSTLFRNHNNSNARPSSSSPQSSILPSAPLPLYQQLLAGASAGVSYNFVFFPADTIKSRMQTEEVVSKASHSSSPTSKRTTFYTCGKALWRQQGLAGMYRGCGITVARAAPSSAFIFAVYEGLKGWFG